MKKLFALLLAVCLLLSMAACSASAPDKYVEMPNDAGAAGQESGELSQDAAEGQPPALPENRKLIRTVHLQAETKDLPSFLQNLEEKVASLGGYLQQRNLYNGSESDEYRSRSADLTVRIPADRADEFLRNVEENANVVSSDETVDDVTLDYVATDSRKKALEAEEKRLLELMESAETMSDLLEIEERLTQVRGELESIVSQLRTYDDLVDYATVYLHISQVRELTPAKPETFWNRISSGFVRSVKGVGELLTDLAVWLIAALPYLLLIAVLVIVIVLICKVYRKKHPKKNRRQGPTQTPQPPRNLQNP